MMSPCGSSCLGSCSNPERVNTWGHLFHGQHRQNDSVGALAQQYHGPVQGTAAGFGVVPAIAAFFS
jgi:hypothetical protein